MILKRKASCFFYFHKRCGLAVVLSQEALTTIVYIHHRILLVEASISWGLWWAYTGLLRNCPDCMLSKLSPSSRTFGGLERVLATCRRFGVVYVSKILRSHRLLLRFDASMFCFPLFRHSPLMKMASHWTKRVCEWSTLEGFGRQ